MQWVLRSQRKDNNATEDDNDDDYDNEKERKTKQLIKIFGRRQNVSVLLLLQADWLCFLSIS